MEKKWNKKWIETLLSNDEGTREAFIQDFGAVIYTWMYYQVGADEQIATELTVGTLGEAIRNISGFNPAETTLFAWLKENARKTRDEGLGHRQMKPQRPWAWSQLPEDILCGISHLRSESLQEKIVDNPFIHEIIQASLTELEQTDRELLIHRYNHLDTVENISEEMNCPIEDVQSRLYRSRHSFRRVFFQIISKANPGFSESNATGEIDTLDMNLEKLLSTTAIYQALNETKTNVIRQNILEAIQEAKQTYPERSAQKQYRPIIIAAGILIFIAGLYIVIPKAAKTPPPIETKDNTKTATETNAINKIKPDTQKTTQDSIDDEELKLIYALGQEGNVEALLEILKSGQFVKQAAAAYFIGKLADPSAINLLEQAEEQWYPEPQEDSPFAQAITEILNRFPEVVPATTLTKLEPNEIQAVNEPPTPEKIPNITGVVSDFSNQPIAKVKLELTDNTLFSKVKDGKTIASVETNATGQYRFSENYEGPAFLTARIPLQKTMLMTRSLWCDTSTFCIVNLGGKPAMSGTVIIDNMALSNQTVYLSDTLNIANASFRQETTTDADGHFSFLGVPAGIYYLMNKGLDNRIRRLAIIEMPEQETYNVNFNLEAVMVLANYLAEPNLPLPAEAILDYTMDASENLSKVQAVIADDGSIVFENVIPGSYVMKTRLDNGVWIQQNVEITEGPTEQIIQPTPLLTDTTVLTGLLLNASPVKLFLTNANQQLHIDIEPNADGAYELINIPADVYSLATYVKGQLIEFTQIDLQNEIEMTLDIDPAELIQSVSPLYVVVTDEMGVILSGTEVWLDREGDIITATSTGRGAFLAALSGNYTLCVAHPDYPSQNLEINLKPSSLLAEPGVDNTLMVRLGSNKP